jgi:succinate-semialdehyde dehydrogenase/glutarate-semialdehyde dehydrogenase
VLPVATSVRVNRVPEGVVAVISPWNYPLTMVFCDGLAALGAGNTVVSKPDSQTVLTALRGLELLEAAGFPADAWQIVTGPGPVIGTELIEYADHVCFTGSTANGRQVGCMAGERLIPASLELGGKNPMVVLADADIDLAADGAVRGCFSNAGQLCVSFERLYVDRRIYREFREAFVAHIAALDLSVGTSWASDVGTLVSGAALEKVSAHVEDAVAKGATVLAGGRPRPDLAPYAYEPTVLEGVTPKMLCASSETFGPVVALYPFEDEAEAVELANRGEEGLNAAVYSRDVSRGQRIASAIRCGTVTVNEVFGVALGSIDAPMGGMGISGLGRRQGREGVQRFTQPQAVATQRFIGLGGLPGMNREQWSATMIRMLRLLRRIRRP